jgi:Cupin-like domain
MPLHNHCRTLLCMSPQVLHSDDFENMLCQLRGTKELTLFPPADISRLYYQGRKKVSTRMSHSDTLSPTVVW